MTEGGSWFDQRVSPSFLLCAGLLLAPAIILQHNLILRAAQSVQFLFLALISVPFGKKRLVIGSLIFVASTIILNLFSPVGEVLVRIAGVPVTRGALSVGVSKATTLASLLFLSRLCVRPSVRLPGRLGAFVSATFGYLNKLLARKERIGRNRIVQRLDQLFESVYGNGLDEQPAGNPPRGRNTISGVAVLTAIIIVNWTAVFFPFSSLLAAS